MGFLGKKESAHLSPLCCISGVPCSCRGSSLGCSGGGGTGERSLGVKGVPRDLCSPVPLQPPPW